MQESDASAHQFSVLFDEAHQNNGAPSLKARSVTLARGETLFEQGDHDDGLYIIDEGVLEVSVLSASGRKLALDQLHAGAVFGEIAILDPGPRTAGITALAPSRLRAIRHRAVFEALKTDATLAAELLSLAGRRLRWISRQMEDQVFLTPASRLAAKLLYLVGQGTEVGMSQAQLADYVGVTREVVSKTLSEWRRSGFVDMSRGRIMVRDADALEDIRDADVI